MKKTTLHLLSLAALAVMCLARTSSLAIELSPEPGTLWMETFKPLEISEDPYKGWKVTRGQLREVPDGAEIAIAEGREALISRYVMSKTPAYPYLQVDVASLETKGAGLLVGNASTDGKVFGYAPTGITTFDLAGQVFFGADSKEQFRWALRISALAKSGGSGVIRSIVAIAEPKEGLIVLRKNGASVSTPINAGETLIVKLFTEKKLSSAPTVRFENMLEGREIDLGPGGRAVELKPAEANVYTAEVTLGSGRESIVSPPVEAMPNARWTPTVGASVDVNGVGYHTCLPFTFDVGSKSADSSSQPASGSRSAGTGDSPKDWLHESGPPATVARSGWRELTKGQNLALGKAVTFSAPATYKPTHDDQDEKNLTSGTLSSRQDDRIWFVKDSVGWFDLSGPVNVMVDLGETRPVGRVAIRLLGGREQAVLAYPREIEVLVSEDGTDFRSVKKLTKLLESEKELADDTRFYIPEDGVAAVHAFETTVDVPARYVAWRITPETSYVVSDQIAVMAAESEVKGSFAALPPAYPPLIMNGLAAFPRKGSITVTTGVITPNWFLFKDDRDARKKKDVVTFQFELPPGVELLSATPSQPVIEVEAVADGRRVFTIEPREVTRTGFKALQGPFYFRAGDSAAPRSTAKISVAVNGVPGTSVEVPLELAHIDPVEPLKSQHVSLGWMNEKYALGWPNFFESYLGLGFNSFPVFPRVYTRTKDGNDWSDETKAAFALTQEARERGLPIAYNESPFHTLERIGPKVAPEAFNDLGGKPGNRLSPVYRGKYYQEEIQRVATNAELVKPDIVFYDIELWHHSVEEGRGTAAMREAFRKSGKSEDETLSDLGLDKMRDLRKAINGSSPDRPPVAVLYNNHAERPIYQYVFDWKKIYPGTVDLASPSLYVRGDCAVIHHTMVANYKALGNRKTIPWLTTGTYGEFDPALVEPQIYETILNGSWGLTYYCFHDFDPMDYYYQAKAFRTLKPYDALIGRGDVLSARPEGAEALVSAYGDAREALLLVGNYHNPAAVSVRVTCDGRMIASSRDIQSGDPGRLEGGSVAVDVPAFGYRLLHVEFAAGSGGMES